MNQWLSKVLEFDVILIRSPADRLTPIEGKQAKLLQQNDKDMKSTFKTCGSLHLINQKSVLKLKEDVALKY